MVLLGSGGLLLAVVLLAVGVGSVPIPPQVTLEAIYKGLSGQPLLDLEVIVWQLRLPRVAMGLLVGASLAMSGAAYQGLFRNPLADPYLMGVASGGAFGATLAILLGLSTLLIPPVALVCALISVAVTLMLARRGRALHTTGLVLAGVVVGSILTAASTYLMLRGEDRIREVFAWTLGNLSFAGWKEAGTVLPYALLGFALLLALSRPLNTLQLGEATAHSLGLPVERVKWLTVLAATLSTAAAVSYAGIIGFVGLITPHIVRRLVGADFRLLLPASAIAGGTLLVLADLLARTLTRPAELPVGIVTTLLGGPFFLYLLRRQR
nr:iron ABC transporter permease [Deinobacterium chartae]